MPSDTKHPKRVRTRARLGLPLAALAAGFLLAGGVATWVFSPPAAVEEQAAIGGPFTLVNSAGQTVTDRSFRGKVMLVYFGYTYCPDVCPTTLNDVAAALDKLGPAADKLTPVFITVDPARDVPKVMGQYTAAFSPRIQGLTGSAEQIKAVAGEYRVYFAKHPTGPGPDDYTMDHSSILYVMRPNGQFAGVIRADESPDALAGDLKKYVS